MSHANPSSVVLHGTLPEALQLPSPAQQAAEESPDEILDEDFSYLPVPPTIVGHIKARFHETGRLPPMPLPDDAGDEEDE